MSGHTGVKLVATGLPATGTEVPMSSHKPTFSKGHEALYTQSMMDCQSIATFDRKTGARSLAHLIGGDAPASFWQELATGIGLETTVLMVAGANVSESYFENFDVPRYHEELLAAMKVVKKDPSHLMWVPFWGAAKGLSQSTFVIEQDGSYGRIKK